MILVDAVIKDADQSLKKSDKLRFSKHTIKNVILSGGSIHMPKLSSMLKNYFGKIPLRPSTIRQENAAVIGAAMRGYFINHREKVKYFSLSLIDFSPMPFGVETVGGLVNYVTEWATIPPFKRWMMVTTTEDGQTEMSFRVLQGLKNFTRNTQ